MPPVILAVLKYFFIFLIFLFLMRAVRAMYWEIKGPRATRPPAPPRSSVSVRDKPGKQPDRLAVIGSRGEKPQSYSIDNELIIGRADKCHVVLTDDYASQVHARIFRRDDSVFIEDMGSTNGTYLNRRKVTSPVPVNRGDKARIGRTELEFKR